MTKSNNIPRIEDGIIYKPDFILIDGIYIRRVSINDVNYYCLVDIQRAAGMGEYRSQLSRKIYKTYSFKIKTDANGKFASYINLEGICILLSRSRLETAKLFLDKFLSSTSPFCAVVDYKKFDYERLLDIIVRMESNEDRAFLYDLYQKLGGLNDLSNIGIVGFIEQ